MKNIKYFLLLLPMLATAQGPAAKYTVRAWIFNNTEYPLEVSGTPTPQAAEKDIIKPGEQGSVSYVQEEPGERAALWVRRAGSVVPAREAETQEEGLVRFEKDAMILSIPRTETTHVYGGIDYSQSFVIQKSESGNILYASILGSTIYRLE